MSQIVIPRGELGTAHLGTGFVTTSTSYVNITGMSVLVTSGTRPLHVWVSLLVNFANDYEVALLEDGVMVSGTICGAGGGTGSNWRPVMFASRRNPTAGSHTYSLQIKSDSSGTVTVYGGSAYVADMAVVEV